MIYPVITLYQPWATWIMRGWKTIETRTHSKFAWLAGHQILIHAGQTTDASPATVANPYLTREQILFNPDEVINGHILGRVRVDRANWLRDYHAEAALIDCSRAQRFGLFLEDLQRLPEPIACKGSIGVWFYDLTNRRKVSKAEWRAQQFPEITLF
jgi:hypothetical protein